VLLLVVRVVVLITLVVLVMVARHHSVTIVHLVVDKVQTVDNNMTVPLVATLIKDLLRSMVDPHRVIGTLLV